MLRDVYGDSATVLCSFERAGRTHGLSVLVDFNHLGGWVTGIVTETIEATGAVSAADQEPNCVCGPVAILKR